MGDRATVKLHSREELCTFNAPDNSGATPLTIYVHWHGNSLRRYVAEALRDYGSRSNDHSYFIRCIIHHISTEVGGLPTGMGVGMCEYENEYAPLDVFLDSKQVKDGSEIYSYEQFIAKILN